MSTSLGLILIVAVAYFAAHVVFDWIGRRFRIVSGAEYLVLGILLGPEVSGFMSQAVVQSFAPFMTLALGWVGVLLGMKLYVPQLIRVPSRRYTIAATEAVLTFTFVSFVMTLGVAWARGLDYRAAVLPALSLGAIATASAGLPLSFFSTQANDPMVRQLDVTGLIDGVVAICAFGILLCVVHIDVKTGTHLLTATEWAAISIGIGVVGGALFHLFIRAERDPDRLFIALAGCIILASGSAAFLRISPLLPCLVIGAMLVNTSRNRVEIASMLESLDRPLYYVMLLFAGASWKASDQPWVLPAALYLVVRAAAKLGSARLAARLNDDQQLIAANWGRGLLSQGTIALAIAMSYSLNDTTLVPNFVFTTAIISVMAADLFGVRIISALVQKGR